MAPDGLMGTRYYVTIDFHRGPSYSSTVVAKTPKVAKELAKREARLYGFQDEVKKVTAREA